nr:zinc knuckle CX2CX4HX4C [Tanacetum cinerariifolium]
MSPNNPYVSTMDNWPSGPSNPSPPPRVSRPPPGFQNPPPEFEPLPLTQPLFVNINNNTSHLHKNAPPLENIHHPPLNLKSQDFPNPLNILDFVHPNDMPHLHNMFCQLMKSGDTSVPTLRSCLKASRIQNIDGIVMGKDGNPLKPMRKPSMNATVQRMNSFASVVQNQHSKQVVKIKERRNNEKVDGAAVAIPLEAVEAVSSRFINILYGYFIGNRLAFPIAKNYVKNAWAKYGLKCIQLHEEFFLLQFDTKDGMESVLENRP